MTLNNIYTKIFGSTQWHGLSMNFWFGLALCAAAMLAMNIILWRLPAKQSNDAEEENDPPSWSYL